MDNKFDCIIIGGGPNGLTAAAYLVKAGLKVMIMEKRFEMGGGLATEEVVSGGFYHNTHAIYMMMVDYAPPYYDLELEKLYGLKHIYPSLQFAMPLRDGNCLCLYNDLERTCASFAKFSSRDARTYRELFIKFKGWMEDFLGPYTYVQPKPTLEMALQMEKIEMGKEMFSLTEKTPKELVEEWFTHEHIRALMLYTICFWGMDPTQSGLGYLVPLYFNRTVNYRICQGGSHMLTQALIKVIRENGGVVLTSQNLKEIMVEDGKVKGVQREDGAVFESPIVLSTIDTHQSFLNLMGEDNLDQDFTDSLKMWRWEKWSFLSLHLALDEAPDFIVAKDDQELNKSLIYVLGCEDMDDIIASHQALEEGDIEGEAIVSCTFPTVHDPLQCRLKGRHTGLIQQHAPYNLKEGGAESWRSFKFKEKQARRMMEILGRYAPNMNEKTIRAKNISTPLDCEEKFSDMVQGSIKQGEYHPLQMGYNRPNPECSQHRSPIKGFYMGGACTYPGGTVLLGSGYLAANAVAEDFGIEKWWKEPESIVRSRNKGLL